MTLRGLTLPLLLTAAMLVITLPSWAALLINRPLITYHDLPVAIIDTGPVQPGGTMRVRATRCNASAEPLAAVVAITLRRLDDGGEQVLLLSPLTTTLHPGCVTIDSAPIPIPDYAEPGIYRMEFTISYRGPYRMYSTHVETVPFEVSAP